ncbi:ATP-binding protein [Acetatifactor aquisgranensis]|jgi:Divergent AAA domain.|uniref:ATP-binding protein n=1 Tax=Acetatifactor aquisgranensis TaxID=2941233 RepID=UPI002042568F|nr:ATP-binding protein [Acetatifactor aquisgranensis]
MYDFKLGLTLLEDGSKNPNIVSKIVKTLTAMANTNSDEEGIVIIGVANDIASAQNYQSHYNSNWIEIDKCFVTGINDEVKKYWGSLENYVQYLKREISKQPIQDDVKSQILTNFNVINYEEKTVVILKCKNNGHSFTYKNEFYERRGSNTEKVEIGSASFNELMRRTTRQGF